MIIWLYFTLVAISLILMIFGFIAQISMFNILGAALLLVLGGVMMGDGVQYKIGENSTMHVDDMNNTVTSVIDVYDDYSDSTTFRVSWILLVLGGLALAYSFTEL